MYLNFYSLLKEPFRITPDPAFLYLSPSHREALASILYGIRMRKGFVAVTGEVGTGKTTVIRSCLATLNRTEEKVVYVFNPRVTFRELMKVAFEELGIESKGRAFWQIVKRFYEYLIEEYRAGRNVVLIVDEAQNMPVETLEKLRMLSNLETYEEKLIQIVLVGQPELDEKLNRPELRQLRQRIAVRATIQRLTRAQSRDYIRYRLSLVAPEEQRVFSPRAERQIAKHVKGVPRVINILCDNALVAGYGRRSPVVSNAIVQEVIEDYERRIEAPGPRRRILPIAVSVALFAGLLLTVFFSAKALPSLASAN
ncbi:AAA family ATPase [Candidatus Sumerlaeota bacterium]|nr:AAA family ATPase [Candidatus Sumerlaeota bacterium]